MKQQNRAAREAAETSAEQRAIQARTDARDDAKPGDEPPEAAPQTGARPYPVPPFPDQHQTKPGTESSLEPRPMYDAPYYLGSRKLEDKVALITGGDSGMGRAAAIAYAREGADVAINYFPTEEPDAREVVALIEKAGRKAVAIPGDLRDEDFCKRLVADAVAGYAWCAA